MNEPNRSLRRSTKPIVDLVTPTKVPHVVGMKIVCACSDFKEREVVMDSKLASAVMGFIRHRQGGMLQLSEGVPIRVPTKMEAPPVSEEKGDVSVCIHCSYYVTDCQCPPCAFVKADDTVCGKKPHEHQQGLHTYCR